MVRMPRNVSPAAARRRSLLVDAAIGLVLGLCALLVAAGVGVVGFVALLAAIGLVLSYLGEMGLRRSRRGGPGRRSTRRAP